MLVSPFLNGGTNYGLLDYTAAVLLCAGAAGFGFVDGSKGDESSLYGIFLLGISVVCDGFVPNLQQKMMNSPGVGEKQLSPQSLMVNVNVIGFSGLLVYALLHGSLRAIET